MEKKEGYHRPYLVWTGNVPKSAFLEYDRDVRKTNYLIFGDSHTLPYTPSNTHLKGRDQNPSEYDLIFDTEVSEEKLLNYGILPNRSSAPIVRKDVLTLLQNLCPNDFQYFPITIRGNHKKIPSYENHDYVLLNLLHELDCINFEKTKFSYDKDGKILWIKSNLHFRHGQCMSGCHIGRLKTYKVEIIVSPEFRMLFKKNKIKGAMFLKDREAYP